MLLCIASTGEVLCGQQYNLLPAYVNSNSWIILSAVCCLLIYTFIFLDNSIAKLNAFIIVILMCKGTSNYVEQYFRRHISE
jgi:hypothetical protein